MGEQAEVLYTATTAGVFHISWSPRPGANSLYVNDACVCTLGRASNMWTKQAITLQLKPGDVVSTHVQELSPAQQFLVKVREALNV